MAESLVLPLGKEQIFTEFLRALCTEIEVWSATASCSGRRKTYRPQQMSAGREKKDICDTLQCRRCFSVTLPQPLPAFLSGHQSGLKYPVAVEGWRRGDPGPLGARVTPKHLGLSMEMLSIRLIEEDAKLDLTIPCGSPRTCTVLLRINWDEDFCPSKVTSLFKCEGKAIENNSIWGNMGPPQRDLPAALETG